MIRLYDFNFNLLAETDRCISSEWELKFNGIGTYEGIFQVNSDFASVFAENEYVIISEDDKQAICVGKYISDNLRVYGRTPEWLLSKRIVLPFKTSVIFGDTYTDPETVIIYLLNQAYKTPAAVCEDGTVSSDINTNAVCDEFIVPEKIGVESFGRHFWRNGANPLSDVIIDLCDIIGCGFLLRADFQNKCWNFNLVFGQEKHILISKSLKNVYDLTLKESFLDSATGGYYEIYDADAEQKPYGYIKGEITGTGILYWDTVLSSASGLSEAQKLIKKATPEFKLNCELLGLEYGRDYELGDVVRVQFEMGKFRKTLKRRVTGVSIINSSSQKSIKPTLAEM
ncbi:MAG: hypothetical protein UIM24_05495 [Clostridia bacterium]|nr:hypothetical protein [Clostridia bacterium]